MIRMKRLAGTIFFAALLSLSAYAHAEIVMPLNNLSVQFDLGKNTITGVARISLPRGKSARVHLSGIRVKAVSMGGTPLTVEPGTDSISFTPGSPDDVLKIEYEAEYRSLPEIEQSRNPGIIKGNRIVPEGILLMGNWYPAVEGSCLYRLTAVLPTEFEGISEADEIRTTARADGTREFLFVFDHPLRDLTFIAGKYQVETERYGDVEICTYFFPEESGLSATYRNHIKRYLDMYDALLGKYPFKRFAVVENFLPTGYSFPTFTLLGREVVKLPFIPETSLGHEFLHQWFGNLVFADDSSGNWSEGLTTYLADQRYEELKGKGWEYRKQALISYQSYVHADNDFPLQSFRGREDRASAAIGYGKSAMVFHMLRKMVGDEVFYRSLRRFVQKNSFKETSWTDLRDAFEDGYGKSLEWFFLQWVTESGVPDLEIKNMDLKFRGAKAVISFTVEQKGKNYKLFLPVTVKLREGEVRKVFLIEKEPETVVEIETDAENSPVALVIDDHYDLFRKLSGEEYPPVISRLLGDDKKIFVVPQGQEEAYERLSGFLRREGFTEKKENEISYDDIKGNALLIPGRETSLVRRLFGKLEKPAGDFSLMTKENPLSKKSVIAVFESSVPSDTPDYLRRITHYGKYSNLSFEGGKDILKNVDASERGISTAIIEDTPGVEVNRDIDLYDVIKNSEGKDIIYVGEVHDRFADHRVQLRVIMELYRKYNKIAIGMEMFQKPFQQALDDYIAGGIDEKTFLRKSEYFQRWGFDYNLYREILLFARAYKIPVIALNVRKEIVTKVSHEGLRSLSDDELKEVPEYFDLSDSEYRNRLRAFFERHSGSQKMNFDFFYEAQVLWDESMAQNLDQFVRKNPEHKVVVLAGEGHMAFGSGIPKRAYRLNKRPYAIILNGSDIEKDIADFVLFPSSVAMPESPKLGVLLKEKDKKVSVERFAPDSIAEKAGLKENDIILSLDDALVESVDDMRVFLLSKKKGDEITIKILRNRFLFGPEEKEFKVIL
jgi:aminopeptidase N